MRAEARVNALVHSEVHTHDWSLHEVRADCSTFIKKGEAIRSNERYALRRMDL